MNFVKLLLTKYIERMGTGIIDMITRCKKVGIPEPEIRIDGGHFVLTLRRKLKSIKTKKKTNDEGFFFLVQDGVQELGDFDLKILSALADIPLSSNELVIQIGYSQRTRNFRTSLNKLLDGKYVEMTIPNSPRSKNQKYRITVKGRKYLKTRKQQGKTL